MKTFEEAFEAVTVTVSADAPQSEHQRATEAAIHKADRFADVGREAGNHESLKLILESIHSGACCGYHAMLSACRLGMQIGIEMEKSETGGVVVE